MKKGTWKKLLVFFLSVIILVQIPTTTSRADKISELQQSIKEKQAAVNNAKNEKKNLQTGLTNTKQVISSLQSAKNSLSNYVTQLDATLTDTQEKINELKNMIAIKEADIEQTTKELEEAIEIEENQYAAMKERIKYIYERGDNYYIELLLTATGFSDMLNRADYVEDISAYDRKMLDLFKETRAYVEVCKEELEAENDLLQSAKLEVEAEEAALEELISVKEKEISAYQADINVKEAAAKEYQAMIEQQEEEIAALEEAIKADQAALAEAQRLRYDGGVFAWPAPSYTRISDDYGNRMHPILKKTQFHNGLDLAAPGGSPILAAYNGKVIAAAYSSTMGNYVMIDHGDGLYTIYMHASALYVSRGDMVSRGQKIAAVGTTGRSTGNHLHFGVRLNGNYVSPWNYLGK